MRNLRQIYICLQNIDMNLYKYYEYVKKSVFFSIISHVGCQKAKDKFVVDYSSHISERLLFYHVNTPGFLAPRGEEFNPEPETRLDRSELLCNKVLLKYKGDRESF